MDGATADGGPGDVDGSEPPVPESRNLRRKILVVIIALAIVLSLVGIWWTFLRYSSMEDLEDMMVWDGDGESFDPDLAGTSLYVGGKVTNIYEVMTNRGPLTFIELDDNPSLHLIEWREPDYDVGDEVVRLVHFEWARYNNHHYVHSPQIDYPTIYGAYSSQLTSAGLSFSEGLFLQLKDNDLFAPFGMEISVKNRHSFPSDLFNASLWKGIDGPLSDVLGYDPNPQFVYQIDRLESLEVGVAENGTIRYIDANANALLDDGDFFGLNLSLPVEDEVYDTYHLMINDGPSGKGVARGSFIIIVNNKGALQFWNRDYPDTYQYVDLEILSERETSDGVITEIVVAGAHGRSISTQELGCRLRTENATIQCVTAEGEWRCTEHYTYITFSDEDGDGLLNSGDVFAVHNLANWSESTLTVEWDYDSLGGISWTTGLGEDFANFPVIEWGEPVSLDPPIDRSFKLEIERMYGVPGVPLGDEYEMMTVNLVLNGSSVITSSNLTQGYNYTSAEFEIAFEDSDQNGFVDSGDFFVITSANSAEYELALAYINLYSFSKYEQPLVSWPVTWQTG